ncbi:MAG: hypothetical protein KDA86_15610 [Planctomycetaceae bacterium]|nr:hypothetical protein [Planctomycetaceae bacterium]
MLKAEDYEHFRDLLHKVETRIRGDYEHLTDEALENFGDSRSPQHLAELGTDAYEREFSLRFAESDQHVLEEIQAALGRIEDGTYGLCEDCLAAGKSNAKSVIPKTRLKEIPYARHCVSCERERESREAG